MRILVTQMTRMGDMLQTSPLIRALRRRHPSATIAVMVRPMGKPTAERNPDIDEIFIYDEDAMFLALRSHDSLRLLEAYKNADAIISWIGESHFDVVYNCTHSIASAMLLRIAEAPQVVGAHATEDWRFVLRGKWANYFFASVYHRDYNDLNLCDITGRFPEDAEPCRELVFEVEEEDRRSVSALLAAGAVREDESIICLQLGASDEEKRWAVSHFADLAKRIVDHCGARIFLVGTADEAPLGNTFEGLAPGLAVPLYGKTSIAEVAALLERSRLLVTNDTGTMHVAAAVGCPVVLVSVGYVHFRETGPYGVGHFAVECRRPSEESGEHLLEESDERNALKPEQVMAAVATSLDGGAVLEAGLEEDASLAGADLYRSDFAPDGCLEWYPLVRRPLTKRDFLRFAYRIMWLDHLGAMPGADAEEASCTKLLASYTRGEGPGVEAWREEFEKSLDELERLSKLGVGVTGNLLTVLRGTQDARTAERLVGELMDLDEEVRILGEMHRPCRPLVSLSRFERDNLESADALTLGETTLRIYEDCLARATLIRAKMALIARVWAGTGVK